MRILITGGAGCLGSNLIEYWLPQGHEIFVIDNFATGKREVLPKISGLTVVEGSVADVNLVNSSFKEFMPTHVIHSAASYNDPQNWTEDVSTNVLGTVNVVKAALAIGVDRLINFQTALCYGAPIQMPISIDHPTSPFTSYGISKTAGEQYLLNSELNTVSLRLANICSPRLAIGPIPTFYKRLKAGQDCFCSNTTRDFLHISDFFSLMDKVVEKNAPSGVFNVSTGVGNTIKEVFEAVADYLKIELPNVPIVPPGDDDVPMVVLDPSETEKKFGWQAKVGFNETIQRQLAWYDAYGVSDIYSHLSEPTSNNAGS